MALDWGNVPGFLSFGISFWALFQARHTTKTQRRNVLQEQARLVVVSTLNAEEIVGEPGKIRVRASVRNFSPYPISEVWLNIHSQLITSASQVSGLLRWAEMQRQLLLELANLPRWTDSVTQMLDRNNTGRHPWPSFTAEWKVWA